MTRTKPIKKILALALSFALMAAGIPVAAMPAYAQEGAAPMAGPSLNIAEGNITCDQGGEANAYTITGTSNSNRIVITGGSAYGEDPIYVTLVGVNIDLTGKEHSPVEVTQGSHAVITIEGENKLVGGRTDVLLGVDNGRAGLDIKDNAFVTLQGDGTLEATGGGESHGAAGIGSSYGQPMGSLTIKGSLTIVAKGTQGGAGIGGGNGHGSSYGGDVDALTIEGGNITATGGENAAGIGSGEDGDCSGIEINENTTGASVIINATGGKNGAGIGSGEDGNTTGINISGGDNITARGGENGAGIGSGSGGYCSNIEIFGGTISATGGKNGAGIGGGQESKTFGIKIHGGGITAIGGAGAAGIGGGKDEKTDGITISGGNISAQGGEGAAGIGGSNGNCDNISISGGVITSVGGKRGAGIGGGDDGKMTRIAISGGTITATGGERAAGIGAGDHDASGDGGDVDSIEITGGTIVLAQGGEMGAGIGGSEDGAVSSITLNGATVQSAQGGYRAAGIGGGYKGELVKCRIQITDSTVTATGGMYGAGIGGGQKDAWYNAGDINAIGIDGTSKITATGGNGGAGIGSGVGGSVGSITFSLVDTPDRDYYVRADGGDGAADIGSGKFQKDDTSATPFDQGVDSITITGGHIVAGVIGGYNGPYVYDLVITGGYIEADCVGAYYTGENNFGPMDDIKFIISGGTVDADDIVTDFADKDHASYDKGEIIIDGGSVRANLGRIGAKNANGDYVVRTTVTLADAAHTLLKPLSVSPSYYGTKSIYSDGNKMVYFYLPRGFIDPWVEFGLNSGSERYHYYADEIENRTDNVLKMDGALNFRPFSGEVVAGEPFTLSLDDGFLTDADFAFQASGAATVDSVNQARSPGANVTLNATGFGSYTVTAEADVDDPIYWKWVASYSGSTSKAAGEISIIENPSTIYGGTPVSDPSVSANSAGAVTYTYYEGVGTGGTSLGATAPANAGTYTVVTHLAATSRYTEATSAPVTFTIAQRGVTMGISTETGGLVTVQLFNAVDAQGEIKISLWQNDTLVSGSEVTQNVAALSGSGYGVSHTYSTIPAGTYTIQADYIPALLGSNYVCVNSPATVQRIKDLSTRTIDIGPLPTPITYGDNGFNLDASTANTTPNDQFTYEVIYDEYNKYEDAFGPVEDSVHVDASSEVTILNAGTSYIKITLTDTNASKTYDDAVLYVPVTVAPAPLTVKPHATKEGVRVTEAEYGAVGELNYELEYGGFVNFDDESTFTNGHGTLRAKALDPTLDVSNTAYDIEVEQVGAPLIIDKIQYEDVFFCRNYDITVTKGTLTVEPAVLTVKPDDTTGEYQNEPSEYTYTITGMAPWDSVDSVFVDIPVAGVDYGRAGGSAYDDLEVGEYQGVILMDQTKLEQRPNGNSMDNYSLPNAAGDTGTLTVTRITASIGVDAISKVYNGSEIIIGIDIDHLHSQDGGTQEITHYRRDAPAKPLDNAPVEAGSYIVVVEVFESNHYNAATAQDTYVILKARPDFVVPVLPDIQYSNGLKLSAQALPTGWTWVNPDTALSVGTASMPAKFTPADTTNHRDVYQLLTFEVLAASDPDPAYYTISVSASPNGGGTVSGGGSVASGSSHTVAARASGNYRFTSWTENGAVVSTEASYLFIVNSHRNLVAHFTYTGSGGGGGGGGGISSSSSSSTGGSSSSQSQSGGPTIHWHLNIHTGTLTITGTGVISRSDWGGYQKKIQTVVIENGITAIGANAFGDCTNLRSVTIPPSVTQISDSAFPPNVTIYGKTGSYAQQYAQRMGIPFVATDAPPAPVLQGWQKIEGTWYYYLEDGTLLTSSWIKDSKYWYYMGTDGKPVTGWLWYGGDWYYLENTGGTDTNGRMLINAWIKDSHGWAYLESGGTMRRNGWARDSKGWLYLAEDGYPVTGEYAIDGQKHLFDDNGYWQGEVEQ